MPIKIKLKPRKRVSNYKSLLLAFVRCPVLGVAVKTQAVSLSRNFTELMRELVYL